MPYSLLPHNTFGIDATCDEFLEYHSEAECLEIARRLADGHTPWLPIGAGSNLLFLSRHYGGCVVHNAIKGMECVEEDDEKIVLRVGGGEVWDDVVACCTQRGWHGLENLSLIPGETGAAAVQNIGAYGAEVADHIVKVEGVYIRPEVTTAVLNHDECHYGYRQSIFKQELKDVFLVTRVWLRLSKHFTPHLSHKAIAGKLMAMGISPQQATALQMREAIISIRQDKLPDPKQTGNAGSFFMNPVVPTALAGSIMAKYPDMPHYDAGTGEGGPLVKIPAAWLIEQCGWKGKNLGRAGVNPRQPLVLTNLGGASGNDISALATTLQHDVKEKFGIELHPEVRYIL